MTHLKETVLMDYIVNTLILVVSVSFLTFILGVGSAYLTTFYDFRFAGFFVFALALPFAIPTYIMGTSTLTSLDTLTIFIFLYVLWALKSILMC